MRWIALLLVLSSVAISVPAHSQSIPGGPSGDFRVEGRPGTAPTVGPPGGPSLPPGPATFRDSLGGRSPDEILKSIDKELGKGSFDKSEPMMTPPSLELERELRSPADKVFR
jgi:hypothetical protein